MTISQANLDKLIEAIGQIRMMDGGSLNVINAKFHHGSDYTDEALRELNLIPAIKRHKLNVELSDLDPPALTRVRAALNARTQEYHNANLTGKRSLPNEWPPYPSALYLSDDIYHGPAASSSGQKPSQNPSQPASQITQQTKQTNSEMEAEITTELISAIERSLDKEQLVSLSYHVMPIEQKKQEIFSAWCPSLLDTVMSTRFTEVFDRELSSKILRAIDTQIKKIDKDFSLQSSQPKQASIDMKAALKETKAVESEKPGDEERKSMGPG